MSLNRRIGLGFTLGMDPTGGTSFTTLGAIVDGWDESEAKADVADIAILADAIKQKAKSQIDAGEVTFDVAWDPDNTDTGQALKTALLNLSQATIPNFQISYPSGTLGAGATTHDGFFAHVTGLGRSIRKGKLVIAKVTLTKTGTTLGFGGS